MKFTIIFMKCVIIEIPHSLSLRLCSFFSTPSTIGYSRQSTYCRIFSFIVNPASAGWLWFVSRECCMFALSLFLTVILILYISHFTRTTVTNGRNGRHVHCRYHISYFTVKDCPQGIWFCLYTQSFVTHFAHFSLLYNLSNATKKAYPSESTKISST